VAKKKEKIGRSSARTTQPTPAMPTRSHDSSAEKGTLEPLLSPRPVAVPYSSPWINHNNIFLFIPNMIGYTRVVLAASSLYFMRWHPKYCTWLYIISCLLDAFDGMAARKFGQSISPFFVPG
jgi:hypothetical protein